jgi:hypothetical protein
MIRRTGIDAGLVAIALMLGACAYTYSTNPLSAPGDAEPDARLEGVWQGGCAAGDCVAYAFVIPLDNGLMDIDFVGYPSKGNPPPASQKQHSSPVKWGRYLAFRTEIDGAEYLNVMPVAGELPTEQMGRAYFIVKYHLSDDGLWTIWLPSDETLQTLRRDVEEGRLAGIQDERDLIVKDDAENLRWYLRWGENPFTEHFLTLRKILPKVPGR